MSVVTVAALYIDPRGPYPALLGAPLCWDAERDGRLYEAGWPVVAHPPCGPWGRLRHLYRGNEHDCGPRAVEQVRAYGGVLEHPAGSKLWEACGLPTPTWAPQKREPGARWSSWPDDAFGGYTIELDQCEWGHACKKPTWLYLVGVPREALEAPPYPGRVPTHGIFYGRWELSGHAGPRLIGASKEIRRRTPPEFAAYLVRLARSARTAP